MVRRPRIGAVEEAIAQTRVGRMVVVVDDRDRENEGDLIVAAEKATSDTVNFMVTHGRGLVCVAVTGERLDTLRLPLMVAENTARFKTAFTVSVEARDGTTTGVSAHDRATTIRALADPATTADDFLRPGHVFPLRAAEGGVLRRPGHTEAAVDLARLAGLQPAGVLCEILDRRGAAAPLPYLTSFARRHRLALITIANLIAYRLQHDRYVRRETVARLPTRYGEFTVVAYRNDVDDSTHLALTLGEWDARLPVLTRIHSECLTGDVLASLRCDCGDQLHAAMARIAREGRGVLVYVRQEGRGIGLRNKIKAYALQDGGMDTVEANEALGFPPDAREYGVAAQILLDLGVRRLRLLTNNPLKRSALARGGLEIVQRVPLEVTPRPENMHYLKTKREKLGHLLTLG